MTNSLDSECVLIPNRDIDRNIVNDDVDQKYVEPFTILVSRRKSDGKMILKAVTESDNVTVTHTGMRCQLLRIFHRRRGRSRSISIDLVGTELTKLRKELSKDGRLALSKLGRILELIARYVPGGTFIGAALEKFFKTNANVDAAVEDVFEVIAAAIAAGICTSLGAAPVVILIVSALAGGLFKGAMAQVTVSSCNKIRIKFMGHIPKTSVWEKMRGNKKLLAMMAIIGRRKVYVTANATDNEHKIAQLEAQINEFKEAWARFKPYIDKAAETAEAEVVATVIET